MPGADVGGAAADAGGTQLADETKMQVASVSGRRGRRCAGKRALTAPHSAALDER
jgi:hypothetical protein